MAEISVTPAGEDTFRVDVGEGGTSTSHVVTVHAADLERYAAGRTAEELLEASFRFLLEREPKEAILSRFDLPVIERYFGDYPMVIANYLR